VLFIRRRNGNDEVCIAFSFSEKDTLVALPMLAGRWHKLLDTEEERWLGGGGTAPASIKSAGEIQITLPPRTCVLFRREKEE